MRILIIEDHAGVRQGLQMLLELEGHSAQAVSSCDEGLLLTAQTGFDVVLLDLCTGGLGPMEFMKRLRGLAEESSSAFPRVVVISGNARIEEETLRIGAAGFVRKPFTHAQLLDQLGAQTLDGQVFQG